MKTVHPSVNFSQNEKQILEFWKENDIFKKSLDLRKDSKHYLFYDGPPFATGLPHYGHLLAGTLKDIVPRYQTMKGHYVERRFGWDTHGLPVEMLVEKELGLNGRLDILEYGVDKFNEACRASVFRYVEEWERFTNRYGRWIDFENDYKTMDLNFMESGWWVFKELWNAGRVYEGTRVMPYSWRLSTTLSQSEASANYRDVQDPAVTVRFKLNEKEGTSILVWTTTPWTLPSNMALCVGPDIEYVEAKTKDGEKVILAEARLEAYFPEKDQYEVLEKYKGEALTKFTYQPLFDFYASEKENGAFVIVSDGYVSTEDGTGIVHQSPAHGEDDHRIGAKFSIPLVDPVDADGKFQDPATPFKGQNVKEADKDIIRALKEKDLLFKQDTLVHSYPFCERSGTPLIYKAITAWYIKVEDIRENMLENNRKIHWVPEHVKTGRFHNWLKNARDWNVSRNRFWGSPIPIWRCESCGHLECIGSKQELEEKSGEKITDLHKHFVDALGWPCEKCKSDMKRISEVFDCWFESGSMPYAQLHYPFENKELFKEVFPADFIAEGLDQTRGWFYTLMILSSSLFGKAPFQNVIVNGMILAKDGKKMSKSLRNYPDPLKVLEEFGADALRLYLINSPVVKAEPIRFDDAGVKEILRTVLIPYWNVYSFFTTYANVDNFKPDDKIGRPENVLDQWIISRYQTLLLGIEKEMAEYRLYAVVPVLLEFIEETTNWYVRRSRRRFWSDDAADKQDGYNTLYYILNGFSRALAPFLPFVTEEIYRNLATLSKNASESVHLTDYPVADKALISSDLESGMALIKKTVGLGRALRSSENLQTRRPLQSITVVTRDEKASEILQKYGSHIKEELNVKEVLFSSDESALVNVSVKPNFPVLGPIFGKRMGELTKTLQSLSAEEVEKLENGKKITVMEKELDTTSLQVIKTPRADVKIETSGGVTVFYDTNLTEELISEGQAREFVNRVQRMRKEADFNVSDRITVNFTCTPELCDRLKKHAEYIKEETLCLELKALEQVPEGSALVQEHEIDESKVTISVSRK